MEPSCQSFTASPVYMQSCMPDSRRFLSFQFLWKCVSERCHVSIFSFLLVLRTHQVQRIYTWPTPPLFSPKLQWSHGVCDAVIHPLAWTASPELPHSSSWLYVHGLPIVKPLDTLPSPLSSLNSGPVYCHISSCISVSRWLSPWHWP